MVFCVRSANTITDHGAGISRFRQRAGLPAYDLADGSTGTVARAVVEDGRFYHGVNTKFSPASIPSRMDVVAELQAKGYFKNVTNIGQAPMLAHAEAHALMRAFNRTGSKNIALYVDRPVCGACRRQLGLLADHFGIDNLKIHELGNPTPIPIRPRP